MANRSQFIAAIPPIHPSAVQLMRLAEGSSHDLGRIVALLRSGAIPPAELTRAANSPLFPTQFEIRSPLQALVYLGLERVKALVATAAMRDLADAAHGDLKHACWHHSLATAVICQRLAPLVSLPPEKCYVAGLIHDVGRFLLLAALPEYERLGEVAAPRTEDPAKAERSQFGWSHTEAGRWLLGQWGFPLEMQNVAAFHEDPSAAPNSDRAVISLVHTGSDMADTIGMSAFPGARGIPLGQMPCHLPEVGEGVTVDLPDIMEWVATKVNGIELSFA